MKRRPPPAARPRRCFRRVIEEHPATPWALLAQRELKDPLGFKWVETLRPAQPRGNDNAAAPEEEERIPIRPSRRKCPSFDSTTR